MSEIETLISARKWSKARSLIQEELVSAPTDHWLWLTLGLTYYEQKHYEKALACSTRAVELQPDCPLALWHYAGALFMAGREDAAFAIWTLLRNMDFAKVANEPCGEGEDWAMQLLNDVHYRLGRYHQGKGEKEQALASFAKYLHNRDHGVGSLYDADRVRATVTELARDVAVTTS